jgi:hypothetical protein
VDIGKAALRYLREPGDKKLAIVRKEDGYWLDVRGSKSCCVHLGSHGPIVNAAISEAWEQSEAAMRDAPKPEPVKLSPPLPNMPPERPCIVCRKARGNWGVFCREHQVAHLEFDPLPLTALKKVEATVDSLAATAREALGRVEWVKERNAELMQGQCREGARSYARVKELEAEVKSLRNWRDAFDAKYGECKLLKLRVKQLEGQVKSLNPFAPGKNKPG